MSDQRTKSLDLISEVVSGEPVCLAWGDAEDILKAIWPEVVELLAKIMEYEHALEHTADRNSHIRYEQEYCEDCARVAQSALDGVNREDFREMFLDDEP